MGAGTYRCTGSATGRRRPRKVVDAHSLYFEMRAELGWIGLVLLVIALVVPLVVAASRLRGPGRHAYAAFLAGGIALLLHAQVDWDWEMPVLFIWFFGAAGTILAAPAERAAGPASPQRLTRLLAGLACLLLALTPVTVAVSQLRLNRSVDAFARGDCATATDAALDSLEALSVQAEAFEVLGWCDARAGQLKLAVDAMRTARRLDPGNWQYAYGLAASRRSRARTRRRRRGSPAGSTRSTRWPAASSAGCARAAPRAAPRGRGEGRHPARMTRLTRERRAGARLSRKRGCRERLSAARRCGAAARGPRSGARCRRAAPGSRRSP